MSDEFEQYKRTSSDDLEKYKRDSKDSKDSKYSKTESAIRGASQGATLGFGDEIQALLRAMAPVNLAPSTNKIPGTNIPMPSVELNRDFGQYSKLRDEQRIQNQGAQQENPGSYLAGQVAGTIPQALNIAGIARNAGTVAGSKLLGGAISGGSAGATYGAAQGAGNAETMADVPIESAKQAGIGAAGGAISGGLAGRAAAQAPWSPKTLSEYGKLAADKTKENAFGNLISAGSGTYFGGMKARESDWSTDPYSAAVEVGKHALMGAAGGKLMSKGLPFAAEVGKDAIKGAAGSTMLAPVPFAGLTNYLQQAQGTTNPRVEQAAQEAQQATSQDNKRKVAMELTKSPTGRAVGNSTSPVRNEDEENR